MSFISILSVQPLNDFRLALVFNTGEEKEFDMTPYLEKGIFTRLQNNAYFNSARVENDTVTWGQGEIDLSPDTLYLKSI